MISLCLSSPLSDSWSKALSFSWPPRLPVKNSPHDLLAVSVEQKESHKTRLFTDRRESWNVPQPDGKADGAHFHQVQTTVDRLCGLVLAPPLNQAKHAHSICCVHNSLKLKYTHADQYTVNLCNQSFERGMVLWPVTLSVDWIEAQNHVCAGLQPK